MEVVYAKKGVKTGGTKVKKVEELPSRVVAVAIDPTTNTMGDLVTVTLQTVAMGCTSPNSAQYLLVKNNAEYGHPEYFQLMRHSRDGLWVSVRRFTESYGVTNNNQVEYMSVNVFAPQEEETFTEEMAAAAIDGLRVSTPGGSGNM